MTPRDFDNGDEFLDWLEDLEPVDSKLSPWQSRKKF